MKRRKLKKVPRYTTGTAGTAELEPPKLKKPELPSFDFSGNNGGNTRGYGTKLPADNGNANSRMPSQNGSSLETGINTAIGATGLIADAFSGEPASIGKTIKGIGTGAQLGMVADPVGAAVGGALGGLISSWGSKGSVDESTGKITESTGLVKLFGFGPNEHELARKSNRIISSNNARAITNDLRNREANTENSGIYAYASAEGGLIPDRTPVLLDKGEINWDPYLMEYRKIDYPGNDTDNFATTARGAVFTNDLKLSKESKKRFGLNPKKSFSYAEALEELLLPESKGTDAYAQNTNKLNNIQNNKISNALLADQEMNKPVKAKKYGNIEDAEYGPLSLQKGKVVAASGGTPSLDQSKLPLPKAPTFEKYRAKTNSKVKLPSELPARSKDPKKSKLDLAEALYGLTSIAPLFDKPEAEVQHTPVSMATYVPVGYDVTPQLNEIDLSAAISAYNAANKNSSTGANLALLRQLAVDRARAKTQVLAHKYNVQNQQRATNAQISNNWADKFDQYRAADIVANAQNRAAARNMWRTNKANAFQNWGNIRRDRQKLRLLKDVFPHALDYDYIMS